MVNTTPQSPYFFIEQNLDDKIKRYCRRSEKRRRGSFQSAYEEGRDINRLIVLLDRPDFKYLKKRPNGTDPFDYLAGHPDCRVGSRQLRRYNSFYLTVTAIRKAGYEPVLLGVSHYAEVAKLKSVEAIVTTLQQVVGQDLSVRELIAIVDQQVTPEKEKTANGSGAGGDQPPVDWKKALGKFIGAMNVRLAEIDKAMPKTNLRLDKETAKDLRDLQSALGNILKRAGK